MILDLKKYQKEVSLKDGTKILLRPMVAQDQDALYEFFKEVPREEVRYLRDDVSGKTVVENWAANIDYTKTLPLLAFKNGTIIADATLNRRRFGWKWHLGSVRVFVHRDYRNVGLGQLMIKEIASLAHSLGLEKLVAELPEMNAPAISAFNKAGFHRVAFLPNFVKDRENRPVDLVIMVNDIKPAHDEDYDYEF